MASLSDKYPNDLFNNYNNEMPCGIRILIITRDSDLNSVFYSTAKCLYDVNK